MDVTTISVELGGQVFAGPVLLGTVVTVLLVAFMIVRAAGRRRTAATRQRETVARHEDAVSAYRASAADWQQHREELRALLDATQRGGHSKAPKGLDLQRGERVYFTTMATLDGTDHSAPETGLLTITSRRVVLQGEATHVWDLDAIAQIRHAGQDRTLIRPCQTCVWVGLSYAEGPLTRMYLEVVTSTSGTARTELVRNVAQGLNDHELRRPRTPLVPEPAPGLGRRRRADARAWYADKVAETDTLRSLVDGTVRMVPTQPRVSKETAAKALPVAS